MNQNLKHYDQKIKADSLEYQKQQNVYWWSSLWYFLDLNYLLQANHQLFSHLVLIFLPENLQKTYTFQVVLSK